MSRILELCLRDTEAATIPVAEGSLAMDIGGNCDKDLDLSLLGRVGFIGTGAAGGTLARVLAARGAHVTAVAARRPQRAEALAEVLPPGTRALPPEDVPDACDLVFLAVSDDAISTLAKELRWRHGQAVVHLSGARPADALAAIREHGAHPGALHPLMTFTQTLPDQPTEALLARLSGCTWTLEADDATLRCALETLVAALGGQILYLHPEDRVPYHIAAVFASNYVVALLGGATELWRTFGAPRERAIAALLPLLRAALENLSTVGLPEALTGPVARGDAGTVATHLAWLEAHVSQQPTLAPLRETYVALARLALPLAAAKGTLSIEDAEHLRALLQQTQERATGALELAQDEHTH